MKAVALNYSTRELEEREIPEPQIASDDDVLLKVREVGICGTDRDLASFRISFPPRGAEYLVLGHECVAEVLKTGSAVSGLHPGDVVVPIVRRPCAAPCWWCSHGRRDLCSSGQYTERGIVGAHGYFTEMAVDKERDLVRIPGTLQEHAVFIEPLSVVEKAVGNAFRLHPGEPRSALILGAGPIGLLAAMVLRARGISVDLCSLEPPDSDRARLAEDAGAGYLNQPEGAYDIVIEAAGASQAALRGLDALAPNGVIVMLGATKTVEVPMLQLILRNQVIAGSVNASPADFGAAVEDLGRFPAGVLRRMVQREPAASIRSTLMGPLRPSPKIVHVLA
jgi:threonine dehydrogenase-like Zn-dependent dehydrogenase